MLLRILPAAAVRAALPMSDAIAAMREAFLSLSSGTATVPQRVLVQLADRDLSTLTMPGVIADPARAGAKLLTIAPRNAAAGRPVIHGLVVMFDPDTGIPLGVLEGMTLTAIRTGAASGLATEVLARSDARSVGILGAGVQARTQLEAVCTVRDIEQVRVWSRSRPRALEFAAEMAGRGRVPTYVEVADTPGDAVAGADVVVTATPAAEPLLDRAALDPGVHVNAVGSYTPEMCELAVDVVESARVVVDSRAAAREEAGELIAAVRSRRFAWDAATELGDILAARAPGRRGPHEITLFKSVGVAVQDLSAAARALARAAELGVGSAVEMA